MTDKEYFNKCKMIARQADLSRRVIDKRYALDHNPVKIGDAIKDQCGIIKVENIEIARGYDDRLPFCIYHGLRYKKDGNPRKDKTNSIVYQSNIISINGVSIKLEVMR